MDHVVIPGFDAEELRALCAAEAAYWAATDEIPPDVPEPWELVQDLAFREQHYQAWSRQVFPCSCYP